MLNKFISVLIVMFLVNASVLASNEIQMVEEAFEGTSFFYLGKNLSGVVKGSICGGCEEIKLKITPQAKAFMDNEPVTLKSMSGSTAKPDLVFFDIKTKQVTRIFWQSKQ